MQNKELILSKMPESEAVTVTDLMRQTNIPRNHVARYLEILRRHGEVERDRGKPEKWWKIS